MCRLPQATSLMGRMAQSHDPGNPQSETKSQAQTNLQRPAPHLAIDDQTCLDESSLDLLVDDPAGIDEAKSQKTQGGRLPGLQPMFGPVQVLFQCQAVEARKMQDGVAIPKNHQGCRDRDD